MATDVAAPSTSSGSPSKDLDSEAKDLIGQGRRHLVLGEIPNAVNCFQECCGILAAKYGETADEVGEAYYMYGRSLIELARLETGVLGNALQGVPDESDSEAEEGEDSTVGNPDDIKGEEREKVSKEVGQAFEAVIEAAEAAKEKKDTPEQEADAGQKEAKDEDKESDDTKAKDGGKEDADTDKKDDGKKDEDADKKADEKEEKKDDADAEKEDVEDTGKSEEEVSLDEEMETGEDQSEGAEEKDSEKESEKESEASEDVGNLQLAWEVLELARNIYSKKETKEDRLKLAQIYLHLGEIGLETEKYDQAAEDFMSCLKIQQELLDAEDRLLAESYPCIVYSGKRLLQGKIEELETGKGKDSVSSDDPIVVHRKEVEELNALLPEISSKIEDAEDMKKGAEAEARLIMASELKGYSIKLLPEKCEFRERALEQEQEHHLQLHQLLRLETGVLGNALQGVPDESDSEAEEGEDSTVGNPDDIKGEEREKVSKEVGEAFEAVIEAAEAAKEKKGEKDTPEQEADAEQKEAKDEDKESDDTKAKDGGKEDADTDKKDDGKKDEDADKKADEKEEKKDDADAEKEDVEDTGKSEEEVSQDEEMETGEDQSEGAEEKDSEKESEKESEASEDVGNLQLAWEVLELARNIYSKKETKEDRLKLAQIYLHLGEIGLETEKYDQAAEDFMSCLKIQQELLDAEDRLLAESHYQLGLAYSLSKDYDKSIEYYRNSHNVIKSRIGLLQGKIEELETGKGKESVSSDDPIVVHRKEVEELNALLPEISSKIEDAEDMKKGAEAEARLIMASELGIGAGAGASSSAAPASTIAVKKAGEGSSSSSADAKPAADISHLVRKKRKPSDEDKADSSSDAKKPRQENGAGDKAAVNGTAVNGTAVNGTAVNGAAGSSTETSPEKDKEQAKITPKTVEDLKKDQESKKEQDTDTTAMETTSS
uniref:Tetratricopeptide SHNi-TPR domain-containing protein n=1 Tax=Branchiostoma floridae TaxID=7739 RepID=C3YIL0_BRAFL|eukprot:XP_002603932.1 hypothetical protein BRAFLDRAFT_131259 [Branchiostoma floridae]